MVLVLTKQKRKSGNKKKNYTFRAFLIALLAFFGISLGSVLMSEESLPFFEPEHSATEHTPEEIQVHILDVGQGLAVFIEAGQDTLLYDGGGADASSFVVSYLQKQGIETLDYCIASHYDADHLSGIIGALNNFEIGTLIAPDYTYDTKTYFSFINAADKKDITIHHPTASESFPLGDGSFQILAPVNNSYEDENDYSIVIKVTMGDSQLLLTGDATVVSEAEMLAAGTDLDADAMVLGHHGSYSSTGEDFFRTVSPDYAIISCGRSNDYGHPHTRVVNLLKENTVPLYRTDLQGTICFTMTATDIIFDVEPCIDYSTGDEVRYRDYNTK